MEQSAKKVHPTAAKKEIAEIIQYDKSVVQTAFTDKVNLLKEELTEIGKELSKFISHINLTAK